ncbi:hypothetical protein IFR05_009599 [Cadophora sp. M221]|nr:hypothetical protein IFR05_009599 [Cadophora sp. M221]
MASILSDLGCLQFYRDQQSPAHCTTLQNASVTPTKKGNARLTPYSWPSEKTATCVKSTSIPSSPADMATTPATSLSPTSLWVGNTNRSPSLLSSIEIPDISPCCPPDERTLHQVPDSYIRPKGYISRKEDDDSESDVISGPLLTDLYVSGKPPALGLANSIFQEDVTCSPLWVSENDVGGYFKLGRQYLESLPKAGGAAMESSEMPKRGIISSTSLN